MRCTRRPAGQRRAPARPGRAPARLGAGALAGALPRQPRRRGAPGAGHPAAAGGQVRWLAAARGECGMRHTWEWARCLRRPPISCPDSLRCPPTQPACSHPLRRLLYVLVYDTLVAALQDVPEASSGIGLPSTEATTWALVGAFCAAVLASSTLTYLVKRCGGGVGCRDGMLRCGISQSGGLRSPPTTAAPHLPLPACPQRRHAVWQPAAGAGHLAGGAPAAGGAPGGPHRARLGGQGAGICQAAKLMGVCILPCPAAACACPQTTKPPTCPGSAPLPRL